MTTTKKKSTRKSKKNQKKTYVAIVIDRSGSMSSIHKETVDGINQQLKVFRDQGDLAGKTEISLIQFDDVTEPIFLDKGPTELKEWAYNEFRPRGSTAMYDGIWNAINHLKTKEETDDTGFLVCVISDGGENASKEVTQQILSTEIKRLQDSGKWTFTYMMANQDIHTVANTFNASPSNIATYTASSLGSSTAYTVNASNTSTYLNSRSVGTTSVNAFYSNADKDLLDNTK
jgi:Mg-chelatase subunit ChlD